MCVHPAQPASRANSSIPERDTSSVVTKLRHSGTTASTAAAAVDNVCVLITLNRSFYASASSTCKAMSSHWIWQARHTHYIKERRRKKTKKNKNKGNKAKEKNKNKEPKIKGSFFCRASPQGMWQAHEKNEL